MQYLTRTLISSAGKTPDTALQASSGGPASLGPSTAEVPSSRHESQAQVPITASSTPTSRSLESINDVDSSANKVFEPEEILLEPSSPAIRASEGAQLVVPSPREFSDVISAGAQHHPEELGGTEDLRSDAHASSNEGQKLPVASPASSSASSIDLATHPHGLWASGGGSGSALSSLLAKGEAPEVDFPAAHSESAGGELPTSTSEVKDFLDHLEEEQDGVVPQAGFELLTGTSQGHASGA